MSFALCCMLFGILMFFPETDAGELTWKEPFPIQTVPVDNITDHFSKKQLREGNTNATLRWHFALTGLVFDSLAIYFGQQGIAAARPSGQAPLPGFENQYDINWIGSQNLVTLFIFNVTTEVNGIFTCQVNALTGILTNQFSSIVEVDVVAPPSNIMTSSDQTITAPTVLTLNCSADGKPEPTITWTRVSDNSVVYMPLTITGGKDEESYRCMADNGVGKPLTKVVNITILYRPDGVSLSIPTKVCAGTAVTFTCLAGAANPSVQNYTLYKFVAGLANSSSNQGGVFKDTLLIEGLYNYICKASNSVGNTSSHNRTVEVQVSGSIKTGNSIIHVVEGASISVHCNYSGFNSQHVSWVNASNYIVEAGNILKFHNISRRYGGEYNCSASNVCGGDSERVFIDVQYPVEATRTGQNYWVLEGKSEILSCPVAGNPEPNITWYNSSGASVSSEKELETGESGCYICVANNFFGTSIKITECLIVRTGTPIPGQLTIGADYIEEYKDLDSSSSIIFVAEFVEEMKRRCVHFPWYMGTKVTKLSRGSVIVEFILHIETAKTEENRLEKLKAAISANGTFGRYEAGDLVLLPDESTTSTTSGSPKPTEFKCSCRDNETTLSIIIGVLVIIIIALVAVIIGQQRKLRVIGNRRPYEVPEEKDTRFYDNEVAMKHVNSTHLRPKNSLQQQIPNEHMPLQGVSPTGEGSISPESFASNVEYAPLDVRTRSWEVARNDVKVEKIIGKGAFGQVAVGTAINLPLRSGTTTVAIKMVKANAPETDKRDLKAELELMKTLKPHPHVIKLLGSVTESEPLLVLIEYVPYGDLLGYLRKSRGLNDTYYKDPDIKPKTSLTSQQLIKFAWQIADGMSYLSLRKVIHRDLAARNVLVGERETCKITDFGMARDVQGENMYERKTKGRLPVKWTAYESLLYGQYTTKSDVWSYGVVLYEISTIGGSPYPRMEGRKIASLLQQGYRMPKPEHVDNDLYQIMRNCWQKEPKARPSFSDLTQQLKRMENQHKKLINMHIYDNTLYAHIEDLNA